jgi:hypothetical protein
MTLAAGAAMFAAGGLAITFAADFRAATRVSGGKAGKAWLMTFAAAGPFDADFEAVPLGSCEGTLDARSPVSLLFAASGLATSFAAGMATASAGWPITVADRGALIPVFEAVPLGRAEEGIGFCTVNFLTFARGVQTRVCSGLEETRLASLRPITES